MKFRALWLVCVLTIVAAVVGASPVAQAPAAPTFEAASVKRNVSGGPSRARFEPGGRFAATNVPVIQLITQAYGMRAYQLSAAPDWVASERYDIVAKMPEGGNPLSVIPQLLQALLAERFGFHAHLESREMPVYDLVVPRRDRLGKSLQASSVDCASGVAIPASSDEPPCAVLGTPGHLLIRGYAMSRFASAIAGSVDRYVVDRTGLSGTWNIELTFGVNPSETPAGQAVPALPPVAPDAPSIFTAVQEQLGLKLQPTRGAVPVLVVDAVQRPAVD